MRSFSLLALVLVLAAPPQLNGGDFERRLDQALRPRQGAAPRGALAAPQRAKAAPPADPWARLQAGNARYSSGRPEAPRRGPKRRGSLAQSQAPFAVVLACADSRVAPELLFDQGIGDLFVVRVAGNVAGPYERASIEYAVEHLHAGLVLVLGHERCGAVKASLAAGPKGEGLSPDLKALVGEIKPALKDAGTEGPEALDQGVRANAKRTAERLLSGSALLKEAVHAGHLRVLSARYDLDSGKVEGLD